MVLQARHEVGRRRGSRGAGEVRYGEDGDSCLLLGGGPGAMGWSRSKRREERLRGGSGMRRLASCLVCGGARGGEGSERSSWGGGKWW